MKIVKHSYKWKNKLSNRKKTTEIILHCASTPEGKDYTVDQIHKWHLDRGFSGIGYNFVIYRDGTIVEGRPIDCVGAHATNHNSTSVGICYIGGLDNNKKAKDTRTAEQKEAMYQLVADIMEKYNLTDKAIHGHYEFANKSCPCFKREKFIEEFTIWRNKKLCPTCGKEL